ncbi:MAG: hypothetical protein HC805_01960, partial [Alkalinema sp. RL_2_19]|nr:hypothetical protein [Alkalinema sp. RL_2_19]
MSSLINRQLINRWVGRTPYLLIGLGGCIALLLMVSPLFVSRKLDQQLTLASEETKVLNGVKIQPQLFGTTRVEVLPTLAKQRWATYEVQLIDQNNKILVAGVKNAWRENGTWYED